MGRLARLVAYNPRIGQLRQRYFSSPLQKLFKISENNREGDWVKVTKEEERLLSLVRSVNEDMNSPLCFEFCDEQDFKETKKLQMAQTLTIATAESLTEKLEKEDAAKKEALSKVIEAKNQPVKRERRRRKQLDND